MRTSWKAILSAATLGIVAGALIFGLVFHRSARPDSSAGGAAPFVRHSGAPAHGADVVEARLDFELPPPPSDAVAYDIREPLRNGRSVERKSRWIHVPAGQKIGLVRAASGKLTMTVPEGTTFWKEFYLKTADGPQLVERRILKKVSSLPEKNGGLTNGGWRFWAAHYLPFNADGVHGFETLIASELSRDWLFKPDEWLPTRTKSAMTSVVLKERGANVPYVFPGKTNCEYCHGGAMACVENPPGQDVLGFGVHPENMTPASVQEIDARGWLDAPQELVAEVMRLPAAGGDPSTVKVIGMLHNNCLSCHNASSRAAGRETAFVLDPTVQYARARLVERLSARAKFMGPLGKPIVTPGKPAASEILLRMKGEEGRRRMPPTEGGVPDPDVELTALVEAWVGR